MLKSLSRMNNDLKLRKKRNRWLEMPDGQSKHGLGDEDVWRMIKFVLMKMSELKIERNVVIYGLLFHLTGDAFGAHNCKIKVAKTFYKQMIAEKIESSSLCYLNLLKVGLCHFTMIEKNKQKKEEWAIWVTKDMHKYGIPISSQMRSSLRY